MILLNICLDNLSAKAGENWPSTLEDMALQSCLLRRRWFYNAIFWGFLCAFLFLRTNFGFWLLSQPKIITWEELVDKRHSRFMHRLLSCNRATLARYLLIWNIFFSIVCNLSAFFFFFALSLYVYLLNYTNLLCEYKTLLIYEKWKKGKIKYF